MHSSWDEFNFTNEGYSYQIFIEEPFHGGSLAPEPFAGVIVKKDEKELARVACTGTMTVDIEPLLDEFIEKASQEKN